MGNSFAILYEVIREGNTDEVTFEQSPEISVGKNLVNIRREFQVEITVIAKALR